MLLQPPLFPDHWIGIEEDFHVSIRKYLGPDVAPFHHYAAFCSHRPLVFDHPFPNSRMNRNSRGALRDIGFADPLAHVAAVEHHAVAADRGLKLDLRVIGQLDQSGLVFK